jgi:benzil reductase ((S)-benzoin forming)
MKYAIVTGASKGLGLAIAKTFLEEKVGVFSISRTDNDELRNKAKLLDVPYEHFPCDLSKENDLLNVCSNLNRHIGEKAVDELFIVNNAGVVEPIERVGQFQPGDISWHYSINMIAPIIISNFFLHQTKSPVTIMNITSGAAKRPMHGWSLYCSSKAAMDMFTETTALELSNNSSIHTISAFSPGIMDTGMQGQIRSSSKSAFSEIDTFKQYKEEGKLRDPMVVGSAVVKRIVENKIESGKIYNVAEFLS